MISKARAEIIIKGGSQTTHMGMMRQSKAK